MVIVLNLVLAACGGAGAATPANGIALAGDGTLSADGWNLIHPQWSPDGTQIAFIGIPPKFRGIVVGIGAKGRPKGVTPEDLRADAFAWMPDSLSLLVAFRLVPDVGGDAFAIYDLAGHKVRDIATASPIVTDFDRGIAVAPNGRAAVIADIQPTPTADGFKPGGLISLDLTSGAISSVAHVQGRDYGSPRFLAANQIVAQFGVYNGGPSKGGIAVINLVNGETTEYKVPNVNIDQSAATAGSEWIYAVGAKEPSIAINGVWAISVRTGKVRQVTSNGFASVDPDPTGHFLLVEEIGQSVGGGDNLKVISSGA